MKIFLFLFALIMIPFFVIAQNDTVLSNSFFNYYNTSHISIKYNYKERTQTHDYSGNWDFDGDGIADDLFFIGNGAAHLYFHLRIKLSSEHSVKDFPFVSMDMPVFRNKTITTSNNMQWPDSIGFSVSDFDNDGRNDLFVVLDNASKISKKKDLSFYKVLLQYKEGKFVIRTLFPDK